MAGLPDLVLDSRLDTRFRDKYICHVYNEPDTDSGQRAVQRREFWQRRRHLGSGGFGSVWLEQCIKGQQEGAMRAVKEIQRPLSKFECNRELEAIAKFSHIRYARCFAKSFGWYENGSTFFLAMEYFPLGDLQSYLLNTADPLPEIEVQQITFQILEGLKFMHDNGFAHRDIKPANILVQSQPPQDWWIKISDFGISKRFRDSQGISTTIKGTLAFMAPELHGIHPPGDKQDIIPNATDLWALGEITHQLLTKLPVFDNVGALYQFVLAIQSFPKDKLRQHNASEGVTSFIQLAMVPSPYSRLTAEQALQHPWLEPLRPAPSPDLPELDISEVPDMLEDLDLDSDSPSAEWTALGDKSDNTILPARLPVSVDNDILSDRSTDGAYLKTKPYVIENNIWFDPDMVGDPKAGHFVLRENFGAMGIYEDFSTLELTEPSSTDGHRPLRRLALHRNRASPWWGGLGVMSSLARAGGAIGSIGITRVEDDLSTAGADGCVHYLGNTSHPSKNSTNWKILNLKKTDITKIEVAYAPGSYYIAGMTFYSRSNGQDIEELRWQLWEGKDPTELVHVINKPPNRGDGALWKFAGLTGSWVDTMVHGYILARVSGIWKVEEN